MGDSSGCGLLSAAAGSSGRRRQFHQPRNRARTSLLAAQVLIGLINGAFYALLSLGMAIIFGLLNVINFAHGAFYMMGAFLAWILLQHFGVPYWAALVVSPLIVGAFGLVRSEEHTSELQSLMRISYAVFCL